MTHTHLPLSAATAATLVLDTNPWLSCDDCFDQVDRHVEGLVFGVAGLPEDFRTHLRGCPVCFDEARSLVVLVAGEDGLAPGPMLSRFESAVLVPAQVPSGSHP